MTATMLPRAVPPPAVAVAHDGRARVDAAVRLGAGAALWLSLLAVAYWWAAGGGFQDLAGWQGGLSSLGRLTGLAASDLLLAQVLLMSRLPLLERAFGQDRLVHQHRLVGFTSFNLMVAHIVLITWGYAAGALDRAPATFWDLITGYPAMLLALAGTACLVMTAVTSVRAARNRLRYESWHLLHLYGYLGVGLALPHQLWTGQEFLASTAASVYWWSLWALAAGAVLVWRVGLPLWRSVRHRLRVDSVVPEAAGVVSVYLTGRRLDRLPAQAGQFLNWRFLNRQGWTRGNPYSLSAAPDGRSLRITVKELGDGSAQLHALRPGTPVLFEGPFGRLTARARTRRRVALIGAGVGVAPLRALAEGLEYAPGEAVLLHRFTDRPLFEHELHQLVLERGLHVLWLPGHRRTRGSWLGDGIGPADDLAALVYWVPDLAERDVYVCGPEEWIESVRRVTLAAGLPPDQLHIEKFRW
jgi:ferredoxin-NADP reductase/DMSO/TMAO reductase YedYZ heme-binding membrane subunit